VWLAWLRWPAGGGAIWSSTGRAGTSADGHAAQQFSLTIQL
jgi:hypothetical protein